MNGKSVGTPGACCNGAGICQNFTVFSLNLMVSLQTYFWEEMMELHDEIDPKNNINNKLIIQCVNVLIVISLWML